MVTVPSCSGGGDESTGQGYLGEGEHGPVTGRGGDITLRPNGYYWWPQCGRIEAVVLTDSTTIQSPRDGCADAFRRCLGLPVADMGITAAGSLVLVAPCGLPLALACRRLWRLRHRRAAWIAGTGLGTVTVAASLVAGLLGPVAIAIYAVVWSCPGFVDSYGFGRAGGSWLLS